MVDGDDPTPDVRVRVWLGPHLLQDYRAGAEAAAEYLEAMRHNFAGLTVTIDDQVSDDLRPLPCEQLWTLTP